MYFIFLTQCELTGILPADILIILICFMCIYFPLFSVTFFQMVRVVNMLFVFFSFEGCFVFVLYVSVLFDQNTFSRFVFRF